MFCGMEVVAQVGVLSGLPLGATRLEAHAAHVSAHACLEAVWPSRRGCCLCKSR